MTSCSNKKLWPIPKLVFAQIIVDSNEGLNIYCGPEGIAASLIAQFTACFESTLAYVTWSVVVGGLNGEERKKNNNRN